MVSRLAYALLASPILFLAVRRWLRRRPSRTKVIPRSRERVLILGASGGIGRSIALQYAATGANICIVGRRESELEAVKSECLQARKHVGDANITVVPVVADFTVPEDMVRLRAQVQNIWGGLDTLIVNAGVSAIRPLLEVAGLEHPRSTVSTEQVSVENIQQTVNTVNAAAKGNYTGPLIAALAFIPLLQFSSKSPSILLLSSMAAVVPAPTRSIYASTKAAALMLYQSLAIEHPAITFSFVMPLTVEGDFRSSAVDRVEGVDAYLEGDRKTNILTRDEVAKRCIQAVDAGQKHVFIPTVFGRFAQLSYWVDPTIVERFGRKKYNFTA